MLITNFLFIFWLGINGIFKSCFDLVGPHIHCYSQLFYFSNARQLCEHACIRVQMAE